MSSEIEDGEPIEVDDAVDVDVAVSEISDDEVRDELPDDLNFSEYVGPYVFPNNNRRRVPGALYCGIGALAILLWVVARDSPLVNAGWVIGGMALIAIGLYHFVAGWNLAVDEADALVAATKSVGFPVGHASAQMGWRGWLSRPTWRILLYSNEPQPAMRGLVLVDGNKGDVLDSLVEANPEDWTQYNLE